jgi:hypothetical protein
MPSLGRPVQEVKRVLYNVSLLSKPCIVLYVNSTLDLLRSSAEVPWTLKRFDNLVY